MTAFEHITPITGIYRTSRVSYTLCQTFFRTLQRRAKGGCLSWSADSGLDSPAFKAEMEIRLGYIKLSPRDAFTLHRRRPTPTVVSSRFCPFSAFCLGCPGLGFVVTITMSAKIYVGSVVRACVRFYRSASLLPVFR